MIFVKTQLHENQNENAPSEIIIYLKQYKGGIQKLRWQDKVGKFVCLFVLFTFVLKHS